MNASQKTIDEYKKARDLLFRSLLEQWARTEYSVLQSHHDEELGDVIECPLCNGFTISGDVNRLPHGINCLYKLTRFSLIATQSEIEELYRSVAEGILSND